MHLKRTTTSLTPTIESTQPLHTSIPKEKVCSRFVLRGFSWIRAEPVKTPTTKEKTRAEDPWNTQI